MHRSCTWLIAMAVAATMTVEADAQTRPTTQWSPASPRNYTVGRGGNRISFVVIHTVEGSAAGALSWLRNPASGVSAHYVIARSGTIFQCVADSNTAWHAGNWSYNRRSIGIEHEGFAYRNTWTDAQYRASAAMTRWLCVTYGIPRTRANIIGHREVPDPDGTGWGGSNHHTDPGPFFNWTYYMSLVNAGASPSLTAQQVTTETANVRSGPSASDAVIGAVRNGQIYVSNASSNGWRRILYDQRTGWCSESSLVRRTNGRGRRVTAASLDVRTGPGSGNPSVGACTNGQVFVADTLTDNWLRIWYRGQQFWIWAGGTTIVLF